MPKRQGPVSAAKEVDASAKGMDKDKKIMKAIARLLQSTIKKCGYAERKRPVVKVTVNIPKERAQTLLAGTAKMKSQSKQIWKGVVEGKEDIMALFPDLPDHVHPVKFAGQTLSRVGGSTRVYVFASYFSLEISVKKNKTVLALKTYMSGQGFPNEDGSPREEMPPAPLGGPALAAHREATYQRRKARLSAENPGMFGQVGLLAVPASVSPPGDKSAENGLKRKPDGVPEGRDRDSKTTKLLG